jgi:hypothetical protein
MFFEHNCNSNVLLFYFEMHKPQPLTNQVISDGMWVHQGVWCFIDAGWITSVVR